MCFDGEGKEYGAAISVADPKACAVTDLRVLRKKPPPPCAATLLLAVLKGDAMDRAIQRATETGVGRVVPVWMERCEVRLKGDRLQNKLNHWRRVAVSASEQSGRLWVPEVSAPQPLSERLTISPDQLPIALVPHGEPFPAKLPVTQPATLAVGPEGGFSQAELASFAAPWRHFGLGYLTLRAETAPGAALTALYQATQWPDC